MSDNIIIATFALTDAAALTGSAVATAGPLVNLQRDQPTDVARFSSLAPYLVIDLGAVTAFNLIALLFTNLQQAATWRIRTADTEANLTASPTYDSTAVTASPWDTAADRRHAFKFLAAGWSNRWLRIDLDDTGNADGVIDIGRLCIANAYQSTRNITYGVSYGFTDTSQRDRSSAGNTIVNRQGIIPTLAFDIRLDNEAEYYANTYRIQQACGGSRPVLVITEPNHATLAHEKIYYGLLSPTVRTVNDAYRIFSQRYEIEGMI